MGEIIDLEQYMKDAHFNEHVLPFFYMLQSPFHYHMEENKVMFSLPYKQNYLYVFMDYVPRNKHTEKPIILDRFLNVKSDPRTSKGEWVVHKIYEIGIDYHSYLEEYAKKIQEDESIIDWYQQEILK